MKTDKLKQLAQDVKDGKVRNISDEQFAKIEKEYAKKWSDKAEPCDLD